MFNQQGEKTAESGAYVKLIRGKGMLGKMETLKWTKKMQHGSKKSFVKTLLLEYVPIQYQRSSTLCKSNKKIIKLL